VDGEQGFVPGSPFPPKAMNSEAYYEQGNAYRREGNWQKALECYAEAIELDPESPAVHAREMLNSILGFYSKDALNP